MDDFTLIGTLNQDMYVFTVCVLPSGAVFHNLVELNHAKLTFVETNCTAVVLVVFWCARICKPQRKLCPFL